MTLQLRTKLNLQDSPEARTLTELFALTIPKGKFAAATVGGVYKLEIDIHAPLTGGQREIFLDLLRALDPLLVEPVFIRGQLGDETLNGYLGPGKREKEKSRSRLEQIRQQLSLLLPEHRDALRALLADS